MTIGLYIKNVMRHSQMIHPNLFYLLNGEFELWGGFDFFTARRMIFSNSSIVETGLSRVRSTVFSDVKSEDDYKPKEINKMARLTPSRGMSVVTAAIGQYADLCVSLQITRMVVTI